MQTTITQLVIYVALILIPPPITYGLPPCSGLTTGLTERYAPSNQTLYIDDCLNGIPLEKNLPVIDLTTSVVVVMTRNGEVTVQLPQQQSQTPYPTNGGSATLPPSSEGRRGQPTVELQSSDAAEDRQNDPEEEVDCDKIKLFLDDCLMGAK